MDGRGLMEKDGWRIYEFTREVDGHIELVMRPVHTSLATPPDLECVCRVNEAGSSSYDCRT